MYSVLVGFWRVVQQYAKPLRTMQIQSHHTALGVMSAVRRFHLGRQSLGTWRPGFHPETQEACHHGAAHDVS